jgi:hypothetical protein
MLTSCTLVGRLGDKIPGHNERARYVEIDDPAPFSTGKDTLSTYKIPVYVAVGSSLILTSEKGKLVCVKGRLFQDPELGIVVLDEMDDVFTLPKAMKDIVTEHK